MRFFFFTLFAVSILISSQTSWSDANINNDGNNNGDNDAGVNINAPLPLMAGPVDQQAFQDHQELVNEYINSQNITNEETRKKLEDYRNANNVIIPADDNQWYNYHSKVADTYAEVQKNIYKNQPSEANMKMAETAINYSNYLRNPYKSTSPTKSAELFSHMAVQYTANIPDDHPLKSPTQKYAQQSIEYHQALQAGASPQELKTKHDTLMSTYHGLLAATHAQGSNISKDEIKKDQEQKMNPVVNATQTRDEQATQLTQSQGNLEPGQVQPQQESRKTRPNIVNGRPVRLPPLTTKRSVQDAKLAKSQQALQERKLNPDLSAAQAREERDAQLTQSAAKSELNSKLAKSQQALQERKLNPDLSAAQAREERDAQLTQSAAKSELNSKLAKSQQALQERKLNPDLSAAQAREERDAQLTQSAAKSELNSKLAKSQQALQERKLNPDLSAAQAREERDAQLTQSAAKSELNSKLAKSREAEEKENQQKIEIAKNSKKETLAETEKTNKINDLNAQNRKKDTETLKQQLADTKQKNIQDINARHASIIKENENAKKVKTAQAKKALEAKKQKIAQNRIAFEKAKAAALKAQEAAAKKAAAIKQMNKNKWSNQQRKDDLEFSAYKNTKYNAP